MAVRSLKQPRAARRQQPQIRRTMPEPPYKPCPRGGDRALAMQCDNGIANRQVRPELRMALVANPPVFMPKRERRAGHQPFQALNTTQKRSASCVVRSSDETVRHAAAVRQLDLEDFAMLASDALWQIDQVAIALGLPAGFFLQVPAAAEQD